MLYLLWIAGGSALVLYPVFLLANIMSLGGRSNSSLKNTGAKKKALFWARLIITTFFPLIQFVCVRLSKASDIAGNDVWAYLWTLPGIIISAGLFSMFRYKRNIHRF